MEEYAPILDIVQTLGLAILGYIIAYLKKINKKISAATSKKYLDAEILKINVVVKESIKTMEALTERGIKSGELSRKEIRIELTELKIEVARLETFALNNNYKKTV